MGLNPLPSGKSVSKLVKLFSKRSKTGQETINALVQGWRCVPLPPLSLSRSVIQGVNGGLVTGPRSGGSNLNERKDDQAGKLTPICTYNPTGISFFLAFYLASPPFLFFPGSHLQFVATAWVDSWLGAQILTLCRKQRSMWG